MDRAPNWFLVVSDVPPGDTRFPPEGRTAPPSCRFTRMGESLAQTEVCIGSP